MQLNLQFKQLKDFKEPLTSQRKGDTTHPAALRLVMLQCAASR